MKQRRKDGLSEDQSRKTQKEHDEDDNVHGTWRFNQEKKYSNLCIQRVIGVSADAHRHGSFIIVVVASCWLLGPRRRERYDRVGPDLGWTMYR